MGFELAISPEGRPSPDGGGVVFKDGAVLGQQGGVMKLGMGDHQPVERVTRPLQQARLCHNLAEWDVADRSEFRT